MKKNNNIREKISIINIGVKEVMIYGQIYTNPSILSINDQLQIVEDEKWKPENRLPDLLLKSSDDNTYYEVEILTHNANLTNIRNAIKHCANEKLKLPNKNFVSVLVLSYYDHKYFEIIQAIGLNISVIVVQVDLIKSANPLILTFNKVMENNADKNLTNYSLN